MIAPVPSTMAQSNSYLNKAPAWVVKTIWPRSTKPPRAVMIPSVMPSSFFIATKLSVGFLYEDPQSDAVRGRVHPAGQHPFVADPVRQPELSIPCSRLRLVSLRRQGLSLRTIP